MGDEGLRRSERVRRRPEFKHVYAVGRRQSGRFMTVFLLPTGYAGSRLGVAATRKLGGAVRRNRAKRLAREIFRRHRPERVHDVVIVPRREMVHATFSLLEADFRDILRRAVRRQPDKSQAGSADRAQRTESL
jgi:ribonuclease P protein component